MLVGFGHAVATWCDMLHAVGSYLTTFTLSQQHPTCGNIVAKQCIQQCCNMWHCHVAIVCLGLNKTYHHTTIQYLQAPAKQSQHIVTLLSATFLATLLRRIANQTRTQALAQQYCTNLAKQVQLHATPTMS